jgi:hypothetical protein
MATKLTKNQMHMARHWIKECVWDDLEAEDVDELSDAVIVAGIERHWCGGLSDFLSIEV